MDAPAQTASTQRLRQWWPFVLLALAAASRWMLAGARPEAESTAGSLALGCLWAAAVAALLLLRSRNARTPVASLWRPALAGALLLGGPSLALLVPMPAVDPSGLTMSLALTPVVIAIALASFRAGTDEDVSGRLWPGLAAVAGLLLMLAQPSLSYVSQDAVFLLAPLCTGLGAAYFATRAAPESNNSAPEAIAALLGAAILFSLGLLVTLGLLARGPANGNLTPVSLLAVACDGLLALLSVLTLVRLGPARWGAQFTLVPLLILVEGILMVRPIVTARWIAGLVLLLVASIYLLLAPSDPDDDPDIIPRQPRT